MSLRGGGRGTGGVPCDRAAKPFRGTYRGTVSSAALAPIATPGAYGGWTGQNERVTFDVLPGGRSVGNIHIERLYATCTPPLDVAVEPAFLATYPIGPDGSFAATFSQATISGRLSGATATGTVSYASSGNEPYACSSGSVSWAASSPPPPLPAAVPGMYCGSTAQSHGVCLRLAPNGSVSYLRIEAQLDCVFQGQRVQFLVAMGFGGGRVPLRSNLSFEVSGSIEGNASGDYVARGTLDSVGSAAGTLSIHRTSYDDQEGRIYTCKDASFGWQASQIR